MWLHPSGQAHFVESVKRSAVAGGPSGRALEDIFQIMIVVAVQSANGQGFLGPLELPTLEAIFAARISPQR